jgi:DNA segregation ATPase FtsK/SpoIIIE-like protein
MGKTSFLLYLCTILYLQTKGNSDLYITSTKAKDFYPFEGLVTINQTQEQFSTSLDALLTEYQHRNQLLYSPTLTKATDHKSVMKHYPTYAKHFQPIFVIIDEYARFSENKEIQKKVQELVETAGFVNIHIIISTQRPDARTVLNPRIKSNLLARICFTTTDKNNSIVILDQEGGKPRENRRKSDLP